MQPDPIRVEGIFSEALNQPAGQQRAAFLQGACMADAALRARVEELLAAHERAGSFMNTAARPEYAAPDSPTTALPGERPGTVIGRYKLLQLIGEGGFGRVFMAEQTEPVVRRVALKIIKLGMDTRQVIARFEAERQALAMMDHPNIAKVLDAGATPEGRPFFVMELVRGEPITEYCDKNNLSVPERLELFSAVCNAVQHAHQKGIIHRDIKPTNVLVTMADGKPVPKVIDFGIAKATSARLTEKTLFTEFRHLIGTPAYMSPEQAEASGVDIDTRSDIYSLGVLLYELLTGTTPFDSKRLHSAAYGEIQRIIREEEPPKPSTRLSTLETIGSVAAQRQTDAGKLGSTIRGDLDWIVMKCLEKDRTRRYETANALAEEIRRHLSNEPVLAGPPGASYRIQKFVRRHRAGVWMSGGIAAALVLGVTLATWQAVRASRAEAVARMERDRAEEGFRQARQAVDEYFTTVSESTLFDVPGMQPLRKQLLDSALDYYKRFLEQRGSDQQLTSEMAATMYRIAMLTSQIGSPGEAHAAFEDASRLYEALAQPPARAVKARVDLAICLHDFANFLVGMGKIDDALRLNRQAQALREQLVAENPDNPRMRNELSKSYSNIGWNLALKGLTSEAIEWREKANAISVALIEAEPADLSIPTDLAVRHNTLYNVRTDLAIGLQEIGRLRATTGESSRGIESLQQAHQIFEELASEQPSNLDTARRLATCCNTLGLQLLAANRDQEAEVALERAIQVGTQLVVQNPAVIDYKHRLAESHNYLGTLEVRLDKAAEAIGHLAQALEMLQKVMEARPELGMLRSTLASIHQIKAEAHHDLKDYAPARHHYLEAIDIRNELAEEDPSRPAHVITLLVGCLGLGQMLHEQGLHDEAHAHYQMMHDTFRGAISSYPASTILLNNFAWLLITCPDEHFVDVGEALSLARKAAEMEPSNGVTLSTLGTILYRAGEYQAAVETLTEAVRLREGGDSWEFFFLAMGCWQLDRNEEAQAWFARAVEWMDKHRPVDRELRQFRAEATELLGIAGTAPTALAPAPKQ